MPTGKPDDQVKLGVAECMNSLAVAIQQAGGRVLSATELRNMSVLDFIADVAGQNNIRFRFVEPSKGE